MRNPRSLKATLLFAQDTHLPKNVFKTSIVVSAACLAPSILGALSLGE